MHLILLALILVVGANPDYEVDKDRVYHGSPDSFKSPATLTRDLVFSEISAYKQIQKEGLNQNHARYWLLLQKANDVFNRVVAKVATDSGHDLVAESGAVRPKEKGTTPPPDVTQMAIDAVKEVEKE